LDILFLLVAGPATRSQSGGNTQFGQNIKLQQEPDGNKSDDSPEAHG